jgi:predicted hotdog family 3-hydroxylacyl-ACP dehydratase
MVLNQDAIRELIPHRGSMCLLDTVEYWDAERVVCRTSQHRSPGNPLRANSRLSSIHGIEFAAQAMAVHGGLLSPKGAAPSAGLLVSLRDCVLHCERLDVLDAPLTVEARRITGDNGLAMYGFSVTADKLVIEGRASVLLQREAAG